MGYFDFLADAAFSKGASGNTLYYPWRAFGSGFIIESEETHEQIRKFYKKMYMVMLVGIVTSQMALGFWPSAALLPFCGVWYYFAVKKITKELPRTTEKFRFAESLKNPAKSLNWPTLILLEVFSIGFVAGGIWLLQSGRDQLFLFASIGLFGFCGVVFGYMIWVKHGLAGKPDPFDLP